MVSTRRPLEGLLVVAIEQAVAAPFCTSRLADAGATVIKIERPEGDFARNYDDVARGQSSYFVWLNRGKQSLVLDLAGSQGKTELAGLIARADVLVQNLKPGAYDLLIQAESGLSSITGGPDEPARVGISVVDIATGATAHAAILEALIARGISGDGADIRVSMFDVMADWSTVPLLHHQAGRTPKRIGLAHPSIAPYGVFTSCDGQLILISIQSDREWAKLCEAFLEQPELASDPRFATNVERVRNREETDRRVARAFAKIDAREASRLLLEAEIAYASVNDMAGLAAHPHLRTIVVQTPMGPVELPAPAAIVVGDERQYGRVPAIGEHGARPVSD
jgi:itaconate CoA-transferase